MVVLTVFNPASEARISVFFTKNMPKMAFYILIFHPTSLVPVEAIMTMIRAIKIELMNELRWWG